ncbi:MAG: GNAT family N-acetyltransferase [Bacteroidota bacterium]
MEFILRPATKEDLPEVLKLIQELALYERAPQEVTVTLNELAEDGFGERPLYEIILALSGTELLGMSFYFISYSTWKGKCIYLEDIIVKEKYRGNNIGKTLFDAVVMKAKEFGAKRLQWQVLNWNEPAIGFYKKYNASMDETWLNGKLTEKQIQEFIPA